jgi:hypothetical protein
MLSAQPIRIPERLRVVVTLSQLLAQLETQLQARDADQYRSVVRHLADELRTLEKDTALDFVLLNFPSTAEVYENLQYQHAGLCRSPFDQALSAEIDTLGILERMARGPAALP